MFLWWNQQHQKTWWLQDQKRLASQSLSFLQLVHIHHKTVHVLAFNSTVPSEANSTSCNGNDESNHTNHNTRNSSSWHFTIFTRAHFRGRTCEITDRYVKYQVCLWLLTDNFLKARRILDVSQKDFKLAVVIFMIPPPNHGAHVSYGPRPPIYSDSDNWSPSASQESSDPPLPPPQKKNSKWSFMKKTFRGKVYAAGYDAIISKYTHMLLF